MRGNMRNDEFYRQCAEILDTRYDCTGMASQHRTRWNNRSPGHGRFPGYGLIRLHGEDVHVSLRNPINVTRHFHSRRAAIEWLAVEVGRRS